MKKRIVASLFFGTVATLVYFLIESFIMDTEFRWTKTLIYFILFSIVGYIAYRGGKK